MAGNPKSSVKSKTASKNKEAFKPNKKISSGQSDISRLSEDIPSNAEAEIHKEWNVAQSEERYRTILDEMADAYYEVNLAGHFTFVNDSLCRHLGQSKEELLGASFRDSIAKEDIETVYNAFGRIYRTGKPERDISYKVIRKDGTTGFAENSGFPLRNQKGEIIGFRGVGRDVTQRRQMEETLRQSEERYRTIIKEMEEWYFETDLAGNITFFNDIFADILGYSQKELTGVNFQSFIRKEEADSVYRLFSQVFKTGKPIRNFPYEFIQTDGKVISAEFSIFPKRDKEGMVCGFRGVGHDITERKEAEKKIQYQATHDALTGLPNRLMFSQLLNQAIKSARRYKRQFAVLFMDLDRFKIINDTMGHDAGDELLQEIAARLKNTLRAVDITARLGGDEFVILIEEVSDLGHVSTVAHKILNSIIKSLTIMKQECRVTASIGISIYPKDAEDEQSLMKNADMAMYLAKEEGKNNYQFYSEDIQSKSLERLSIEKNLRFALERNELSLHYQAKLDFKTDVITGVEALLRWQNQYLGSVTPTQFITVAEETGLIVPIGRWVMRTACKQNVAWQREGLPPVCMAVNLSLRQLTDDNLINDIRAALNDSGMAPNLLELEITESMVMHNPVRMISILAKIKSMGVRLAIDDFGTGYSSLAQIKHFPIDTLKVDRSFIRNIPQDAEDKAITEAIIAMGKTLSLTVVAEGVETQEQLNFLREHSCDEMQGYHFSKPIAPEQFADLLRKHVPSPLKNINPETPY
jgi:diguanylate cyclase (GGDEF)-like protein/PAS domain S-box-containing protein